MNFVTVLYLLLSKRLCLDIVKCNDYTTFMEKILKGYSITVDKDGLVESIALDGSEDIVQGGFLPGGVHQLAPQTLAAVGQGFKLGIGHGPQTGQHGFFAQCQRVDTGSVKKVRGDVGAEILPGFDQGPQGGGGGVLRVRLQIVVAARPVNGGGDHGAALGQHGLAVFHRQNVVGGHEQGIVRAHVEKGLGPGGGEAQSRVQMQPQVGRESGGEDSEYLDDISVIFNKISNR